MNARPPCPAAWSRCTPCQHPDGDLHEGPCFHIDPDSGERDHWDRNVSWFCAPVSIWDRPQLRAEKYGDGT